jgi:hypothetical protein
MKYIAAPLALAALASLSSPAEALTYTVVGSTAGKPTYTRPLEDLSGPSPSGTGVHFESFAFTVTAAGTYTFVTTGSFNTFLTLYSGGFSPSTPLLNAVVANDDVVPFVTTVSFLSSALSVGTNYALVMSGFDASAFGDYSTTIGGPGSVVAVIPEPATYGLIVAGMMLIALRRSREWALKDL